jgi:GLPGLI family protein
MRKLIFFLLIPFCFSAQRNTIVEYAEIWGDNALNSFLMIEKDKSLYLEIGLPTNNPTSEQIFSKSFIIKDIGYLVQKENDAFYLTSLLPTVKNKMAIDIAPTIVWKLLPETKEILGYNCKKAEANFRGKKVYAFYTPQIPISSGPWKYSGLPGLILEAWQGDEKFHFVSKKILLNSPLTIPEQITTYVEGLKVKKMDFKDFIKKENEMLKKIDEMIVASSPKDSYFTSDNLRASQKEIQFEWEKEPVKRTSGNVVSEADLLKKIGR